jgi:hypothetical protein
MQQHSASRKIGIVDVVQSREWQLNAPVGEVWRGVIDYPSWQGYPSVQHISGPVGQEGEIVRLEKPKGEFFWRPKYCRTVKLDPLRPVIWKVDSIEAPDDLKWSASVDYRLHMQEDGKTKLQCQVIKEFVVPYENERELDEVCKRENEQQGAYMDANFPRLEALLAKA